MKTLLFILVCLISTSTFSADLPKHPFMKPLKLKAIDSSQDVFVSAEIILPTNHKLNKQAPSEFNVYEKTEAGWKKLMTFDLKSLFLVGNTIKIQKRIPLESKTSQVALDTTLFHCDNKNTHCAIESFQGVASRSPKKGSNILATTITGTRP